MADDKSTNYLKFKGLTGDFTDKDYRGAFIVESFTFLYSSRVGRIDFEGMPCVLKSNSPQLLQAQSNGRHFEMTFAMVGTDKNTGQRYEKLKYIFPSALVASFQGHGPLGIVTIEGGGVRMQIGHPPLMHETVHAAHRHLIEQAKSKKG